MGVNTAMNKYPVSLFIYWIDESNITIYDLVDEWCDNTYGQSNWKFRSNIEVIQYMFKNEQDQTLFLLRWPNFNYCDDPSTIDQGSLYTYLKNSI